MKINFEKKLILSGMFIALVPLIFSYIIFVNDKLDSHEYMIKEVLRNTAYSVVTNDLVKEKIINEENDKTIQEYTQDIIANLDNIDIIVICDINGKKYSHLYEPQIGEIFINPDKKRVLEKGESYYSLMEGSAGKTLRWFEPIMDNNKQIGFVMVGKYYDDIVNVNTHTKLNYAGLFFGTLAIAIILSKVLAKKTKKSILNMEPEEIAKLYEEKEIIINNVQNGIIALDTDYNVTEVNDNFYNLFKEFSVDNVVRKLKKYIELKETFEMKELIINNKKVFVTLSPLVKDKRYSGVIIILSDRDNINKVAKEITGIDEVIKSLRVNVHEFKNNLHVILGLVQLEKYNEVKNYIFKIQKIQEDNSMEIAQIEDYYVRALLLSRKLVAKERKITFVLLEESNLYENHKIIDSQDIVTILGNLIENAFDACVLNNNQEKLVEIYLYEDNEKIEIRVFDNGVPLSYKNKDEIFIEGISSKGKERGFGLYLVKNRVDLYNGNIEIIESEDKKSFNITIFKGDKNNDKSITS